MQVTTLLACLDRLPLQLCHVFVKAELQIRHEEFICVCPLRVSLRLRSITFSFFFPLSAQTHSHTHTVVFTSMHTKKVLQHLCYSEQLFVFPNRFGVEQVSVWAPLWVQQLPPTVQKKKQA